MQCHRSPLSRFFDCGQLLRIFTVWEQTLNRVLAEIACSFFEKYQSRTEPIISSHC